MSAMFYASHCSLISFYVTLVRLTLFFIKDSVNIDDLRTSFTNFQHLLGVVFSRKPFTFTQDVDHIN